MFSQCLSLLIHVSLPPRYSDILSLPLLQGKEREGAGSAPHLLHGNISKIPVPRGRGGPPGSSWALKKKKGGVGGGKTLLPPTLFFFRSAAASPDGAGVTAASRWRHNRHPCVRGAHGPAAPVTASGGGGRSAAELPPLPARQPAGRGGRCVCVCVKPPGCLPSTCHLARPCAPVAVGFALGTSKGFC